MTRPNTPRICFIGFAKPVRHWRRGCAARGVAQLAAWDILFSRKPAGEKIPAGGGEDRRAPRGVGAGTPS